MDHRHENHSGIIGLATAVAVAQQTAPQTSLKPGDDAKLAPLAAAKWVQGEGPRSFETGRIYVFETTWLRPAGGAGIPHAFVVKDGKLLTGTRLMLLSFRILAQSADTYPPEFIQGLLRKFGGVLDLPNGRPTPMKQVIRSVLAGTTGDKAQALASAKQAAALAAEQSKASAAGFPVAPFQPQLRHLSAHRGSPAGFPPRGCNRS